MSRYFTVKLAERLSCSSGVVGLKSKVKKLPILIIFSAYLLIFMFFFLVKVLTNLSKVTARPPDMILGPNESFYNIHIILEV